MDAARQTGRSTGTEAGAGPIRRAAARAAAVVLALASAAGATGCAGDDAGEAGPTSSPVTLRFAARVGDAPASCTGRYAGLGVPGVDAGLRDLRMYVHDVRLVDASGAEVLLELEQDGAFQVDGVALLDFEDASGACERGTPEVRDVVVGTAPTGDYRGVRFRLGVPQELNHTDVVGAPPPLDQSALFWGWSDGRIFLAASTTADNEQGGERVFQVQIASAGCVGDPRVGDVVACERPNRGAVELDDVDLERDVIVVDVAALLDGVDVRSDASCHADAAEGPCAGVFAAAGIGADGQPSAATQSLFRVERSAP